METISIRLDDGMMRELDRIMKKHHFATLTEFIRDAIRNRMKELEKEELQKQIARLAGSSKRKTTDEELHKAGEKVFEKLEKKFGLS
jgi:metal-responsive CopG/Arc/MetJ family transcriptional regulator